jgi:hypothetical protein
MVKHIVMWRFKDSAEDGNKKTNIKIAKDGLMSLKGKVESLVSIEVGVNINNSDAAYDLALYTEFKDLKGLDEYQNHPEHLKVAGFIRKVVGSRVVADYEV